MRNLLWIVVSVTVVLAWGKVNQMTYEDEKKEAEHYCEMVRAGHWPNYDNRKCPAPVEQVTPAEATP